MEDEKLTKAVGEEFLMQYYECASKNTDNLHKFYKKSAVCCFGDANAVVGPVKIGEKLAALNGARFDLETGGNICAFQATPEGGILVMVSGLVALNDQPFRRFVQTFLLSRKDNTFAIANDLHRFVDSPVAAAPAAPAPVAVPSNNGAQQQPKQQQQQPVSAGEPTSESQQSTPPVSAPPPVPIIPAVEKPSIPSSAPSKPQPAQSAPKEKQPRAASSKGQQQAPVAPAAPQQEQAPVAPPKPTGPPSYAQAAAKSSSQPSQAPNGPQQAQASAQAASAAPQRAAVASPPLNCSVFIKLGDKSVSKQGLTEALKPFGNVSNVTIGKSSAVATFAEASQAEAALQQKDISADGIALLVEVYRGTRSRGGESRKGGDKAAASGSSSAAPGKEGEKRVGQRGSSSRGQGQSTGGDKGGRPSGESKSRGSSGGRAPTNKAPTGQPAKSTAQ